MDDFESDELIVTGRTSSYEEEGSVATIHYLGIFRGRLSAKLSGGVQGFQPLYSRKLHILVRRASTSCETSLMIFAFSFGDKVVNHFASLC